MNWLVEVVQCPQRFKSIASHHSGGNGTNLALGLWESVTASQQPQGSVAISGAAAVTTSATPSVPNAAPPPPPPDFSGFPFVSTTIIFLILTVECCGFALIVFLRMHGLRYLDADSADETRVLVKRRVDPSTDNKSWMFFFLSAGVQFGFSVTALQVHPHIAAEAQRVMVTIHRLLIGTTCLVLCMALNEQRLHRTTERPGGVVSEGVKRQVMRVNKVCYAIFVLFCVGDAVATHAFSPAAAHKDRSVSGLFWLFIAALVGLAIPMLLLSVWVCFHRAQVEASVRAKRVLFVASLLHLVVMMPPAFWNNELLKTWVASNPCPLHALSFFDVVLLLNVGDKLLFFIFVALEHRRNALLRLHEHYTHCSETINSESLIGPLAVTPPTLSAASGSPNPHHPLSNTF